MKNAILLSSILISTTLAGAAEPSLSTSAVDLHASAPTASDAQDLAKQLQNPVAALISVPFQNNWDFGLGPTGDGARYTMNFQPVIPISLNEDWNLISRTIIPFVSQQDVVGNSMQTGLSDTVQSLFLSPKDPAPYGGVIWGVGPVLELPTATSQFTGNQQFGMGPTIVLLKQEHGFTYGILANHIWSMIGLEGRPYVNNTFLQPFLSYTTSTSTSFTVNTESTYDWRADQWTIPLNFMVAQVFKIGDQPMSVQFGARYYAERPAQGPDWGLRLVVTMLFPTARPQAHEMSGK